MELSYPKSDSLNVLRPQTDTLQFVMRRRPEKKKKKKDDEPEPIVFLGMQIDAPGSMDLFDTVSVTFNEPILELPKEVFYLDQKVDTVWTRLISSFSDSANSLNYHSPSVEICRGVSPVGGLRNDLQSLWQVERTVFG